MAIDGVKIIDSDLAHDVYNQFMDLYDADCTITEIKDKIETWRPYADDVVEYEIFITAYALALWEIGELDDALREEVEKSSAKGASLSIWSEISDASTAQSRQKELSRFVKKISAKKAISRKRKKFKKVERFIFSIDAVLTFQLPDKSYRAVILYDIDQYRGNCYYCFTPTSYMSSQCPTENDILNAGLFIHKIGNMADRKTILKIQPGIKKFWDRDRVFKIPFTIGLVTYGIEHRDLLKFQDKFYVIGIAKINDSFKKMGSIGYDDTFEEFSGWFTDIIDREVRIFKKEKVDLKELM